MSCLELTDEQVLKVIEPMMDDIMAGVAARDYALHSRHFSVGCKGRIPPEQFLSECDRYTRDWGRIGPRTLIHIARKDKAFSCLWQQAFDQTEGEVLALVTVAVKGGRYFVDFVLLH